MYMQLSNKGCTIKQHIQQKTGSRLLRRCNTTVRFN
jgi:hypothetical protein